MKATETYYHEGQFWFLPEGEKWPVEPARYKSGDSMTCNEAAWQVHKELLSTALKKAVPAEDYKHVLDMVVNHNFGDYDRQRHHKGGSIKHLLEKIVYSIPEIEGEIVDVLITKTHNMGDGWCPGVSGHIINVFRIVSKPVEEKPSSIESLVDEFRRLAKHNDDNSEKVKPTDLYYLGRGSAFSDAALMAQSTITQLQEQIEFERGVANAQTEIAKEATEERNQLQEEIAEVKEANEGIKQTNVEAYAKLKEQESTIKELVEALEAVQNWVEIANSGSNWPYPEKQVNDVLSKVKSKLSTEDPMKEDTEQMMIDFFIPYFKKVTEKCNGFEGGQQAIYKEMMNKRYGPQTWEKMEIASRQTFSFSLPLLKNNIEYYSQKVEELKESKGMIHKI